jgi:hypothetical protein
MTFPTGESAVARRAAPKSSCAGWTVGNSGRSESAHAQNYGVGSGTGQAAWMRHFPSLPWRQTTR